MQGCRSLLSMRLRLTRKTLTRYMRGWGGLLGPLGPLGYSRASMAGQIGNSPVQAGQKKRPPSGLSVHYQSVMYHPRSVGRLSPGTDSSVIGVTQPSGLTWTTPSMAYVPGEACFHFNGRAPHRKGASAVVRAVRAGELCSCWSGWPEAGSLRSVCRTGTWWASPRGLWSCRCVGTTHRLRRCKSRNR